MLFRESADPASKIQYMWARTQLKGRNPRYFSWLCHSWSSSSGKLPIFPGLNFLISNIKKMDCLISKKSSGYKIISLSQVSLIWKFFIYSSFSKSFHITHWIITNIPLLSYHHVSLLSHILMQFPEKAFADINDSQILNILVRAEDHLI